MRNPGDDERLAYVNFERRECARKIRYSMFHRYFQPFFQIFYDGQIEEDTWKEGAV